jgi:hypothetical protein
MNLCKYRDIFGKPREGLYAYRIFDIAIIDVILTIILAYIISIWYKYNFLICTLILFLIGIISHWLFCVKTSINNFILNNKN